MPSELYVIVGLGLTGFSSLRYLHDKGLPVAIMDTRQAPPNLAELKKNYPQIPLALGGFDRSLLNQATTLILSPGISLKEPAIAEQIQRGVPVIGDIELFAQAVKQPVIAITGTNAKSTVTTLVGLMLEAAGYVVQVGGNLGVPALDLLHRDPKTNVHVLELSSFQLETTYSLHCAVASVLNITPDHMDRYADLSAYRNAKLRIYRHAKTAVCNHEDALTECAMPIKKTYFTLQAPQPKEFGRILHRGEIWLAYGDQTLLPASSLPVDGKHYQANALAALAIGYEFGLSFEPMLQVLKKFKGLPHRCQLVRELDGVKWYNDSKGTNVGATQAAIEGLCSDFEGKLVLIAGGLGKNADFSPLMPLIEKYARCVVLMGEAAKEMGDEIGERVPVAYVKSMEEAVMRSREEAKPNDYVLLSPACASFDMFKDYAHRGQVFSTMVLKLSE